MNRKKEIWAIFIGLSSLSFLIAVVTLCVIFKNYDWLSIALVAFWFISVVLAFHILNSTRISNIKACWIFVCLSLPLIGPVFFLIFGINPLNKKNRKKYLNRQEIFNEKESYADTKKFLSQNIDSTLKQIVQYGYTVGKRPLYFDNWIKFIQPQSNFYNDSIKLIREAKESICMQFYIYADSIFFKTIVSEIIKRANDGVKVYIIYDWVGISNRVNKKIWKKIMQLSSNIKVAIFNPWIFTMFTSKTNFRSHRKCIIVDNKKAIYGGSNIADEYLSFRPNTSIWNDLNCIIEGPIVNSLSLLFELDWIHYCRKMKQKNASTQLILSKFPEISPNKCSKKYSDDGFINAQAQLYESSPDYNEKSIRDLILKLIGKAKERVWIITPYFIVSEDIMNSLRACALGGVDVKIIMPGEPDDKKYILTVNRSSYPSLFEANIKVYEYHGFCHSKLVIVDNDIVVLGTFNFDFRSFYINFESSLLFISKNLNAYSSWYFNRLLKDSSPIKINSFNHRTWKRIRWRMSLINIYHPLM